MKKMIVAFFLIPVFSIPGAYAQGNGNSASGGLPALIERVEALEAQLADMGNNDLSDSKYIFTAHQTRFTDSLDGTFPFDNVLRIQHTSAVYSFDADGTGTYILTECQNSGIYSDFSAGNSWMNFLPNLCGPVDVLLDLTWEQDDNLVLITIDNHIDNSQLVFDAVISDDGSLMSATNVSGGISGTVFESHALTGQVGVKIE